jgi:hypothetical protein
MDTSGMQGIPHSLSALASLIRDMIFFASVVPDFPRYTDQMAQFVSRSSWRVNRIQPPCAFFFFILNADFFAQVHEKIQHKT